jgi:2',3'-cyclic-nucleotide 2'-phosphodiesterase (5'-nucleotidase family)
LKLTILHTNDLHGRVEQLARIATLVKDIRREVGAEGGHCVYWDAGDAEDTALLESSLTKGSAMMGMLRGAGCDQVALGNGTPIRYGPQAIAGLAERLGRPLLCANMKDSKTSLLVPGLTPYVIETFGSLKVGIIGLTAPITFYATFFKLQVPAPEDVLPGLVEEVRSLGAQTVILLSHLGSTVDKELAEKAPGLDVIVGGHDHLALDPPLVVRDTVIAQAGDFGKFLGRLDLELDAASGRVLRHHGELVPATEAIVPDPDAHAAFEAERQRAWRMMERVIGVLNEPIDYAEDRECAAGNLLADALLERVPGAQIALALSGHWSTGLEAGPLSVGAVFAANRSTANPARVELSGEQIVEFLSKALNPESAARRLHSLRGGAVGLPHMAGLRLSYDPSTLELLDVRFGDEPLDPSRRYIVASSDFEFAGFVGYLPLPDGQVEYEVPTIMPEVLEDYIARHSPLDAPYIGRIIRMQTGGL